MTAGANEKRLRSRCAVCRSPDKHRINRALAEPGIKAAAVVRMFPDVHPKAIYRHAINHLPASHQADQVVALVEAEVTKVDSLSDQVSGLMGKMEALLDVASRKGNVGHATKAAGEIRQCIRLVAELAGKLQQASTVNVFVSPTWVTVQTRIIAALDGHPEARGAVLKALEGLPT